MAFAIDWLLTESLTLARILAQEAVKGSLNAAARRKAQRFNQILDEEQIESTYMSKLHNWLQVGYLGIQLTNLSIVNTKTIRQNVSM